MGEESGAAEQLLGEAVTDPGVERVEVNLVGRACAVLSLSKGRDPEGPDHGRHVLAPRGLGGGDPDVVVVDQPQMDPALAGSGDHVPRTARHAATSARQRSHTPRCASNSANAAPAFTIPYTATTSSSERSASSTNGQGATRNRRSAMRVASKFQ